MTFYPRRLFADGFTLMPGVVFIKARWAWDKALHAHEAVHERQMREIGVLTFWWRYLTSKSAWAAFEVEAYRAQALVNNIKPENYAVTLANGYRLGITEAQAAAELGVKP